MTGRPHRLRWRALLSRRRPLRPVPSSQRVTREPRVVGVCVVVVLSVVTRNLRQGILPTKGDQMTLRRNIKRCLAAIVSVCLACASIAPNVASACEGGGLEWEGSKGKTEVPLFQVSITKGKKEQIINSGVFPATNLIVRYEGEFEDNASKCDGLEELQPFHTCEVKIKCGNEKALGKVFVEGEPFLVTSAKLECVA